MKTIIQPRPPAAGTATQAHPEFQRSVQNAAHSIDSNGTAQAIAQNLRGLRKQWLNATPHLSRTLQINAFALFAFVYAAAYRSFTIRGFHPEASAATVLSAGSLVEVEFTVSPTTYSTYMKHLRAAGLLDYKSQTVSTPTNWNAHLPDEVRRSRQTPKALSAGTLTALRLRPGYSAPVRLLWEDFEECTRDFNSDLVAGNTVVSYKASLTAEDRAAFKDRKQRWKHCLGKSGEIDIPETWIQDVYVLSQFLLPSIESAKTPLLLSLQKKAAAESEPHWVQTLALEDVFALPDVEGRFLAATIDTLAAKIKERLGDEPHTRVWHKVLWRLWALAVSGQNKLRHFVDQVNSVYEALQRSQIRNGSAVLIARMKQSGLWEQLNSVSVAIPNHAGKAVSSNIEATPQDRRTPVELTAEQRAFLEYATSGKLA